MKKPKVIINGQEIDLKSTDKNSARSALKAILEQSMTNEQPKQGQNLGQNSFDISGGQVSYNGQPIEGLANLPPEVQHKLQNLQQLMPELLSGNPLTIFKNLGKLQQAGSAFLQVHQQASQNQPTMGAQPITTISGGNQPITSSMNNNQNSGGSSHNTRYNSANSGASTTPSFDNVKANEQPFQSTTQNQNSHQTPSIYSSSSGEGFRRIISIGAVILIGYLIYEFVLNGKLPF